MKKVLAVLLALIMSLSVAAGAAVPEIMRAPMLNYSADMTVSVDFNTAQQLAELLQETEVDFPGVIELEMFLKSLCSFGGKANIKADISEDFNKVMLSMEADYDYGVDVNRNFSVAADIKMGVWLDLDLTDVANPKCLAVIMSPASPKYTYIDLFGVLDEESKLMTVAVIKMFLNNEFIGELNSRIVECYEENADITYSGKDCTIKLDNEGFLKLMDATTELMSAKLKALVPVTDGNSQEQNIVKYAESGLQILGDGGYVTEYREDGTVKEACDIRINVNDLLEMVGGTPLTTENDVILGFTLTGDGRIFDVGETKVVMPELTDENSVDILTLVQPEPEEDIYYDDGEYYEEYEPEYPIFYVDVYTDYMPDVDGEIYVPFRQTLENAYGANVNIAYDKGAIAVTSEYFEDLQLLSFKVGETKANADGIDFEVGEIILENGVTYVSADFFEIVFGWDLDWASYDLLWGEYNIGFYTENFEEEYYDEW